MQDKNMTPENQVSEKLTELRKNNIKNSLYTKKTELEKLQDDLRYVTGKEDKVLILEKIKALDEEISNSPEKKMIDKENERNYRSGMSFNPEQERYIKDYSTPYTNNSWSKGEISDLSIKHGHDVDQRQVKELDKIYKTNHSQFMPVAKSSLDNHKAFGKDGEPYFSEEEEKENKRLEIESRRQKDVRFISGKIDFLRKLEERLLEAKARAKVKILGGRDTSETLPIEKEMQQIKKEIALGVVMAASKYLGFHIEESDMGL